MPLNIAMSRKREQAILDLRFWVLDCCLPADLLTVPELAGTTFAFTALNQRDLDNEADRERDFPAFCLNSPYAM